VLPECLLGCLHLKEKVAIRITEMVFFRSALSKYVAFVCAKLVKAMNFVDI
jgi:hypothetical protein